MVTKKTLRWRDCMSEKSIKSNALLLSVALIIGMVLICVSASPAFAKTYNQKGDALKHYNAASYKVVKNAKMTRGSYYYEDSYKDTLAITKGFKKGKKFKRYYQLTDSLFGGDENENPQSIAVTPNGKVAYVMVADKYSSNNENNWKGNVYKVDIKNKRLIKKGPRFTVGHGQAMAYNPKTKQLWYVQKVKSINTNIKQISTSSLKVVKTINFRLSKTVQMGNNLAFDKKGRVYFYTRSRGSWGKKDPKNSIKIYQGKISAKKVSFKLIMQGIKYPPGQIGQSLGYNPKSNRLYLVDDGEIISVPVAKLGKLKKSDVRTSVFEGKREFEGISFDKYGNGYFLTNKPYELMTTCKGF